MPQPLEDYFEKMSFLAGKDNGEVSLLDTAERMRIHKPLGFYHLKTWTSHKNTFAKWNTLFTKETSQKVKTIVYRNKVENV